MKKLICFLFFLISNLSIFSQIIYVPDDYQTIQAAIDASINGDTIILDTGRYVENLSIQDKYITLASNFIITQDTSFLSRTIIDGNMTESVITVTDCQDDFVVISGLKIIDGQNVVGGGINVNFSKLDCNYLILTGNNGVVFPGAGSGGGIYCENSYTIINNCFIYLNGSHSGGGIRIYNSNTLIDRSILLNNDATSGANCSFFSSEITFRNSIIATIQDHWAYSQVTSSNSKCNFLNVCIINPINYCKLFWSDSDLELKFTNCILWSISEKLFYFYEEEPPSHVYISYSNIKGGESAIDTSDNVILEYLEGNIDADPLFIDPDNMDFRLPYHSPCIDAGTPDTTGLSIGSFDLEGNLRIIDGNLDNEPVIDIGAYEFDTLVINIPEFKNNSKNLIQIFPNPFDTELHILYQVENTSHIIISIFSFDGKNISTIINKHHQPGFYQINIKSFMELNNVTRSGIYFIKYETNGKCVAVRKLIKI